MMTKTAHLQTKRVISFAQVRKSAVLYMTLPLFCFFCGYLRWYYALLCCTALVLVALQVLKSQSGEIAPEKDSQNTVFTWKTIWTVVGISLLWTYLGGMNGYYYQSWDWAWRNAVYFDLIEYDWPVIYPQTGSALVYYIGHWLPPAVLAKGILAITGSMETGRMAGRILLWLWSSGGITIIILMLFHILGATTIRKRIMAVLLVVFFSGMDVMGSLGLGNIKELMDPAVTNWQQLHLERWCRGYEFSSTTTCLFWAFNQAIIPWMITLCFLTEEHPKNYVFYGVVCLLCGTLPCVGLAILMIAKAIAYCIISAKQRKIKKPLTAVFSVQNLLCFIILFPVVAAFILSCNTVRLLTGEEETNPVAAQIITVAQEEGTTNGGTAGKIEIQETEEATVQSTGKGKSILHGLFSGDYLNAKLIVFLLLETGCYMLLIWYEHRKNYLFYVIGACFLFMPNFHIGSSNDFCMRATIPGLFILLVWVGQFLLKHFPTKENRQKHSGKIRSIQQLFAILLTICIMFGAVTPLVELYRGFYNVAKNGTISLEDRRIMTFKDEVPDNFACSNPEDHFFFRYLAPPKSHIRDKKLKGLNVQETIYQKGVQRN